MRVSYINMVGYPLQRKRMRMDAGTADHPCSPSLSTGVATRDKEVSQESDAVSAISGSEGSIVSRR